MADVARRAGHPVPFWTIWEQTLVTGLIGWAPTTLLCLWLASRRPVFARPDRPPPVHVLGLLLAVVGRALLTQVVAGRDHSAALRALLGIANPVLPRQG